MFVAAGAVLVLEILAVRLLAPYVGLTLEATTSIIGAALAGISIGAAIGGYLADRTNTRLLIVVLLIVGGLLAMLIVPLVDLLGPRARGEGEFGALAIAVVTLVPTAAVLSAVSPAVAHLQLHDLSVSGTIVGRLSAWATAGALIGTFGAGFVIMPLMPVGTAVLLIGVLLVGAGITLAASTRQLSFAALTAITAVLIGSAAGVASVDSPCLEETEYHCITIVAEPGRDSSGYFLLLDDTYQSFVDPDDPTRLEFGYTEWIGDAVNVTSGPKAPVDAVMVGGGGFTIPRWLDATHPGSTSLVLELDEGLIDFMEERLELPPSPAFRAVAGDARVSMLDVDSASADLVVGDAFTGFSIPWHLATTEWLAEIRRVLRPGGLYAINMVDGPPLDLVRAEAATLLDAFAEVHLVAYPDVDGEPKAGNLVLLAADRRFPDTTGSEANGARTYRRRAVEAFAGDAELLRDDFAPTDQLLANDH